MSDTYIVTAKTVDEAIAKANKLYADANHEISYQILEMPKKGFLGMGAKNAMLKVTVTTTEDVDLGSLVNELKSMKIHTARDGADEEEAQNTASKAQKQPHQAQKAQNQEKANDQKQPQPRVKANDQKQQKPRTKTNDQKQKPEKQQKPAEQRKPMTDALPKEHAEVILAAPVSLSEVPERVEEPADEPLVEVPARDEVRVAVSEEEMQYALEFANTILRDMQIDARAESGVCPEGETYETTEEATVYPKIEIVGAGTGILIGHHGETLDAIQYLVNLSAIRKSRKTGGHGGDYVKIVVDVENYRTKREETLRGLARRMAARAVKNKHNVFLEPMNAYERRIIHSELQDYPDVSTHSVGSDRNRKIIITYEGADKQPSGNRRRGQRGKGDAQKQERRERASSSAKVGGTGSRNERPERPRPKKPQKVSMEKFFATENTEPEEILSMED